VVSARACAYQFLPYSSSGITLFDMRVVQADSCLDFEQIDTLFLSVGGQEGSLGGESFWAGGQFFNNLCISSKALVSRNAFAKFGPSPQTLETLPKRQ